MARCDAGPPSLQGVMKDGYSELLEKMLALLKHTWAEAFTRTLVDSSRGPVRTDLSRALAYPILNPPILWH
jgi:hypothetical protein